MMGSIKKSNGIDYKEGINLLDGGSSEDEHEHFSLPPLNLRGATASPSHKKKKKRLNGQPCCSTSVGLLFLAVVLLSGMFVAFAVYTFSLRNKVNDIEAELKQSSTGVSVNEQAKQVELESMLAELKSRVDAMDGTGHKDSPTTLANQLKSLASEVTVIKDKLATPGSQAPPDLAQLPSAVTGLTQTLATQGSKIKTVEDSISTLQDWQTEVTKDVEQLKTQSRPAQLLGSSSTVTPPSGEKKKDDSSSSDRETQDADNEDLNTMVQREMRQLSEDVSSLNSSLTKSFTMMSQRDRQHWLVVEMLKNKTESLDMRLGLLEVAGQGLPADSNLEPVVQVIVDEALKEIRTFTVNQTQTASTAILHQLQPQIDSLSTEIKNLSSIHRSQTEVSQKIDLLTATVEQYRGDTSTHIQYLNGTVQGMKTKLQQLEETLKVQGVHLSQLGSGGSPASSPAKISSKKASTTTVAPTTETGNDKSGESVKPIQVTFITNRADLESAFTSMDTNRDGMVTYEDISLWFRDDTPPQSRLETYDQDGDGQYSRAELNFAFGFRDMQPTEGDDGRRREPGGPPNARKRSIFKKEVRNLMNALPRGPSP